MAIPNVPRLLAVKIMKVIIPVPMMKAMMMMMMMKRMRMTNAGEQLLMVC